MKKLRLFLFIFIISSFAFPVGEAGAIFLLIAPGAGAQGTGEANVAAVNDAYASYYNPASLAFQTKSSIAGMHVNWLKTLVPDLYYEYLGFSYPMGDLGGFGGHLIFLSLGEQTQTDETGEKLGTFSSYMYALDGSYGTKLTKNSAIGLGFKIYHQKLADGTTAYESNKGKPYSTDFAFDISYLYKYKSQDSDYDNFNFGFNIANIGPPISFVDESQADPAPTNMRLGLFANLYKDEFTRFNVIMDVQKLLVAKYPSMDWDGDGLIGDGALEFNDDDEVIPGTGSYTNSEGQNEGAYADPWYTAWVTAWLDDWLLGGDIDYNGDKKIGGWYWMDGWDVADDANGNPYYYDTGVYDGSYDQGEFILASDTGAVEDCGEGCSGDAEYSVLEGANGSDNEYYKELGSGDDRSFSNELEEVIFNTGFEYWYTDNFVLRCGYIYDKEGDIKAPTFGAGLRFSGYGFDFGYTAGEKNHPRTNSLFFSIALEI